MSAVRLLPKTQPRVSLHKLCRCSLRKGKTVTAVGKYVEGKQAKVARKLEAVMSAHAARLAKKAAKLWVNKMLKADSVDAIVASILADLDLNGVSIDIIDGLIPEMVRAFKSAGILGIGQVGITADADMTHHLDKAALAYADAHGAELVTGINSTTEDALRGTLTEAVKGGWSTQELSASIQESFAFDAARANTIARTELATAHVQGNVQGWRETGQVAGKEWVLGDMHDINDECDDNAADGIVPMEAAFSSGHKFPPAHPNCICDVLPVLSEEGA